jgi:hypothetical protein
MRVSQLTQGEQYVFGFGRGQSADTRFPGRQIIDHTHVLTFVGTKKSGAAGGRHKFYFFTSNKDEGEHRFWPEVIKDLRRFEAHHVPLMKLEAPEWNVKPAVSDLIDDAARVVYVNS